MEVDGEDPGAKFVRACAAGDISAANDLLRIGASVTFADSNGQTPLLAAAAGSLELAQLLIKKAASPDVVDNEGMGAALLAAQSGQIDLMQWLLQQGVATLQECSHDESSPLLCAASSGQTDMVKWLLDCPPGCCVKPSIEECDSRGADALLCAAEAGALDTVKELMQRGAATQTVDSQGCGIFHYAAAGGHVAIVRFCAEKLKIQCDVRDADGDTPLLIAAYEGHVDVVKWLLGHGSSLAEKNNDGMSTAMAAAAGEKSEVLKLLSKRGDGGGEHWLDDVGMHPNLILNFIEAGAADELRTDPMDCSS